MQISGSVVFNVESPLQLNTPETDVVGVAATGNIASGGVPPYTVSISDPQDLPPGVTVGADGTISGTPTTAGTYTVTGVSVSDSAGAAAAKKA